MRPSKYDPKYCDELIEYFKKDPYKRTHNSKEPADFPTLAGFAVSIGIHRETLNNWGKQHPEFFDAIKTAKTNQEHIMITNGMLGLYDKSFCIFAAKNILGWRDKQEIEQTIREIKIEIDPDDSQL